MKTDPELGHKVNAYLLEKGVETPMRRSPFADMNDPAVLVADKRMLIASHVESILSVLGLDLTDDSLQETPQRVAKMYVDEIFYGLDYNNFPKCTAVDNKMKYDEMVVESNISVQSNCEHHLVVISGKAQVGYIPKDKVLGLSKLNRIVEFFSKRPQIQERLTEQVFHTLCYILGTDDVAVTISAEHYCVKSRGVRDEGSFTTTSKLGGRFLEARTRAEFFALSPRTV